MRYGLRYGVLRRFWPGLRRWRGAPGGELALGVPQGGQVVPPPPFLPPAAAGAGIAAGSTPIGGGVGVGAVSAFPSQPYIPDVSSDVELVQVRLHQ